MGNAGHQEIALRASRESIVMLKNEGLLPLDRKKIRSIAVCGPNADEESYALTHYGPLGAEVTTVVEGLRDISGAEILYSKGCELVDRHWPESEIFDFPMEEDERVKMRVASGGHNIPEPTIRRRYAAGIHNLFELYLPISDYWMIADNSMSPMEVIAKGFKNDKREIYKEEIFRKLEQS